MTQTKAFHHVCLVESPMPWMMHHFQVCIIATLKIVFYAVKLSIFLVFRITFGGNEHHTRCHVRKPYANEELGGAVEAFRAKAT